MNPLYNAQATTLIHAPVSAVWEALVNPALIRQYMFDTDVVTDWKVGSPILYKGVWQGKPFEDRGQVVELEPEKRLVTTHWSPLSGVPDTPENYHRVSYELSREGHATRVTLIQDNNASAQEKQDSEKNWGMMLEGLKKLLEKND